MINGYIENVNAYATVNIPMYFDENGVPNAMNATWGSITDMNEITISMSEHKTTENLKKTGVLLLVLERRTRLWHVTMWV